MLGKLIRHEFRATGRIMLPVMGALLALALLANLSIRGLAGGLSDVPALRFTFILIVVFFVIGIIAAAIMALVIMISRFYRNFLKDEGYLMFTLPASTHELIWAKLIVSLCWYLAVSLLIVLITGLTGLNIASTSLQEIIVDFPSLSEIHGMLRELGIQGQVTVLILQGVFAALLAAIASCLHFYAAMALGHMFSGHKVLLSVLFFVVISFAINFAQMGFGAAGLSFWHPEMLDSGVNGGLRFLRNLTWCGIGFSGLQAIVLYLATFLGLRNGLNLE